MNLNVVEDKYQNSQSRNILKKVENKSKVVANEEENEIYNDNSKYMIVGFEAYPCSVAPSATHKHCYNNEEDENIKNKMELKPGIKIEYTYDVLWDTSDIIWASRWDSYLKMSGGKVTYSFAYSLIIK